MSITSKTVKSLQSVLKSLGNCFRYEPRARRFARRRMAIANVECLECRVVMSATPMKVGINLDSVVDYVPNWMFTDVFQSSRPWVSHSFNTVTRQRDFNGGSAIPVQVDQNGWPTQLATWTNSSGQLMQQQLGTLMFRELSGKYPAGTYRAEWDGTGEVVFGFDAREVSRGMTVDGHHFALLEVTPGTQGIYLGINSLSPADPVRNIHVWMPDYNGQSFAGQRWQPGANFSPFHPLYKERIDNFGILRFMQTQETNTSDIVTWSDRRDANDARQNSDMHPSMANGMSVEYMVQLANEVDADPWFNMPYMADDTFVRNFATYVRDHLEPGLTAYVEWANEVWNFAPGYEASYWVAQQTLLPENAGLSQFQIIGREASRDMNIWTNVFAGQTNRIVRTVGGQAANAWLTERIVENMGGSFDAIAIAPYFGPTQEQRAGYTASTTVDQIFTDLRNNMAGSTQFTLNHQRLADEYSLRTGRDIQLLAYEGGQHLDGNNGPYQNAFYQAARDPRMADLTREYLRQQNAAGLDAYVHYKLTDRDRVTQYGLFGVLLAQDQPLSEAHVYRSLMDADSGTLFTTTPTLVTINARDTLGSEANREPAGFRVTRGGNLSQPLTVNYTVSGTAANGVDYSPLSGQVTFPANENTAYVMISPINDTLLESNETVILTLGNGTGYSLIGGTTATASVTITSDDRMANAPTISITATDSTAAEQGSDPAVFTVTRSNGDLSRALSVYFQFGIQTAQLNDFSTILQRVDFVAGQTAATITIRPVDDTIRESRETVIVSLNDDAIGYFLGNRTATANIVDNDGPLPSVTITAPSANATELNRSPGTFVVTRTSVSINTPLTVNYSLTGTATNGADYDTLSGSVIIPAGQLSANITLRPIDDTQSETTETVTITIAANSAYTLGAVSTATASIVDNDTPLPSVTITAPTANATELNRSPGTFVVTRTAVSVISALTVNYTLTGTATNGTDYDTLTSSVVIPAGQTSASITLRPIDDTQVETTESVTITLVANAAYSLGTTVAATVNISDNDAPTQAPLPVLIVIANNEFYYAEYAEPRAQLEAAGIPVVVAAGRRELSTPHTNSGQGTSSGAVMPDIALADVNASNYSAIMFVGGLGASQYQYAFTGTYTNPSYNGTAAIRQRVNQVINDFVAQNKYVTAICHGVSILAWARVNGQSPLQGRRVTTWNFNSPPSNIAAATTFRWHSEVNGATVCSGGVLGNPTTRADDVIVDGHIITAENFESARFFGQTLSLQLRQ